MTPDEVLQRFAEQYVTGAMPLDEATSSLAEWVSANENRLTSRDLAVFHAVGGAIFDWAIAEKMRSQKYSGIAADMLIALIRRRI
ncbi:hypothetical protein OVY01_00960 [Robbsia sp. Bb-Pol-6]|uniref:Uncharacterized protein n=1 Tax=Robbsia betulipollinis TaxID=2981849 RepID=A0ABT3ZHK5_9BURK|nr:hypothetical protein [Robbsia betulipollinis]MCY0385832.1 hypothetical protein [Robbsia betulipollinis]